MDTRSGRSSVAVVDDLPDRTKRRVAQIELAEKRLKRAILADMRVFSFEHVEPELAAFRTVSTRRDELESRLRIYESADKPRAGDAIHMYVLASDPDSPGLDTMYGTRDGILVAAKPSLGFEHRFHLLV